MTHFSFNVIIDPRKGDLGLSNNYHLRSIISRDNGFFKILHISELPHLDSLTMYFSMDYAPGLFEWDWLHKYNSLSFLKVCCFTQNLNSLLLNVSNCKQIEEFNFVNGRWWLTEIQQEIVLTMSHLKMLELNFSLIYFNYDKSIKSFNDFQIRFQKVNPHVSSHFKMTSYYPPD